MGAIASPITGVSIVHPTVSSGVDQRKHQSPASPVTGEFHAQRASNAENVSIWWRHHDEHYPGRYGRTLCLMLQLSNLGYTLEICNRGVGYMSGPLYKHGLTLIPAWINNHMPSKMCDDFFIFILFIKTYLPRITHQPKAVLHEVLLHTTTITC